MRKTTSILLAFSAVVASGCGSTRFANKPAPPQPINLTVYIGNSRVSVSPNAVGEGPAVFTVTNQTSQSESITILPAGAGAGQSLADTGPINPQGTAEVSVNFTSQGDYTISTTTQSSNEAAAATSGNPIQAATIHVGKPRSGGSTQLLTP